MATPQPVLDLDALVERPVVRIGGREYRLFTTDLLPPLDNYHVKRLVARITELDKKDELTNAEMDELAGPEVDVEIDGKPEKVRRGGLLDKVVRLMLDAPAEIHEQLNDKQRLEIYTLFYMPSWLLTAAAAAKPNADQATAETVSPIGAPSPAASPASTPAPIP